MYDLLIRTAADLWAGSAPSEVNLHHNGTSNEYLRGQVELIIDLGVVPYSTDDYDHDHIKALVARDIRKIVATNDRPTLTFTRV